MSVFFHGHFFLDRTFQRRDEYHGLALAWSHDLTRTQTPHTDHGGRSPGMDECALGRGYTARRSSGV